MPTEISALRSPFGLSPPGSRPGRKVLPEQAVAVLGPQHSGGHQFTGPDHAGADDQRWSHSSERAEKGLWRDLDAFRMKCVGVFGALMGHDKTFRIRVCEPAASSRLVLGCKSSRYLKSPFPKNHTIVRLARKWFVRRVFRAATVRERSRDCQPINDRELRQPSRHVLSQPANSSVSDHPEDQARSASFIGLG